jgi:hypothetical protein
VARLKPVNTSKKQYPSKPNKRERIDQFVRSLKQGSEFSARQVAKMFNLSGGEQASGYLWPRDDVKRISHGIWVKL